MPPRSKKETWPEYPGHTTLQTQIQETAILVQFVLKCVSCHTTRVQTHPDTLTWSSSSTSPAILYPLRLAPLSSPISNKIAGIITSDARYHSAHSAAPGQTDSMRVAGCAACPRL
eukprot:3582656-Rhodomonas_salina.1